MKRQVLCTLGVAAAAGLMAGCGSIAPPKYENGEYVPPPAKHALNIDLKTASCGTDGPPKALLTRQVRQLAG